MPKIQLNKSQRKTKINPVDLFIPEKKSHYELNVPGTGRMRTSCNHANFHAVAKKVVVQQKTEPVKPKPRELVKTR